MKKQLVISVMSKDRPGIIADITTVIYESGGDLADLNQSVLGGYFTMILIAEFEKNVAPSSLLKKISEIDSKTRIKANIIEIQGVTDEEEIGNQGEIYIVTVQTENRSGLVNLMGRFFYSHGINIMDLVTTRDQDTYTMIFQIDLINLSSLENFRFDLEQLSNSNDMTMVIQHNDIFMATNEISHAV